MKSASLCCGSSRLRQGISCCIFMVIITVVCYSTYMPVMLFFRHRLPLPFVSNTDTTNDTCRRYMTIKCSGPFGNHIFKWSALYTISQRTCHIPLLIDCDGIKALFPNIKMGKKGFSWPWKTIRTSGLTQYINSTDKIPQIFNVYLSGSFQSWKYLHGFEREIRAQLEVHPKYKKKATDYLTSIARNLTIQNTKGPNIKTSNSVENRTKLDNITFIAVHIRRTDTKKFKYHCVASATYIAKAMAHMAVNYRNAQFIFVSNDLAWVREHFDTYDNVHIPAKSAHHFIDFALLTVCDHVIMTVGTFGWWGAWLAGGNVVYYDTPFESNYTGFDAQDYFPPMWTAMSD